MSFTKVVTFFHHLFNPHCEVCRDEARESKVCESCEVLKQQLEISNSEKRLLIKTLADLTVPKVTEESEIDTSELKPIRTVTNWRTKRAILEKEDRMKADAMRRAEENLSSTAIENIDELEKELGISNGQS